MTPKQLAFIEHYTACGNATEAAKRAGYKVGRSGTNADKLLKTPCIQERLAEITKSVSGDRIARAMERQEFWTTIMRGKSEGAEMKDRLKASELLGRAQGDFIDRVESTGVHEIVVRYVKE